MNNLVSCVEMLIRTPVSDVFNAFVEPKILEKFWLKSANAPLTRNAVVTWQFMVEGISETVTVNEILPNQKIVFTWSDGVVVEIKFDSYDQDTRISIMAKGFSGSNIASQAINATEGFAIVLCDLKSLLETGVTGNMVRDKAALISADMKKS